MQQSFFSRSIVISLTILLILVLTSIFINMVGTDSITGAIIKLLK